MRGLVLSFVTAALFFGGCAPHYGDTSLYQTSGRQKPIVAVLPIIDLTEKQDFSQEFTDEIRKRVYDSKRIYLLREGGTHEMAQLLSTPNPQDISQRLTGDLSAAEYALVAEIIDQEEKPNIVGRPDKGGVLNLALRVRVVDLRKKTPRVILQEVLDQQVVVAGAYMNFDYSKLSMGSQTFYRTPLGMAQQRLARDLVSRVEAYIEATR